MMSFVSRFFLFKGINIDWLLFIATIPLVGAGLVTMHSFIGDDAFFEKQLVWIAVSLVFFFIFANIDWRFLRRTNVVVIFFLMVIVLLSLLFSIGTIFKGAKSWFDLGLFSIQPVDIAKLVLVILLAKYFSRRHIEIANFRHIFVSGIYSAIIMVLVLLQPDFGSSIIIFLIWLGMVLVSGISKKHLLIVFIAALTCFGVLWQFGFQEYQKARIKSFLNPLADIRGSGYNAFQSMIAVGSGELLGKGVGYGTQSRLSFLPEYQTDFIFAAFAEEWGYIGVLFLFLSFGVVIWRILLSASRGATNFEVLFGLGIAIFLMSHFTIHVGMNIGILPVTGLGLPFVSYGGSHLVIEFAALGILMGMRKYARPIHKESASNEVVGVHN